MEGADQVLALAGIDRGLAADRGIDLRQQRGRHLHKVEAAPDDGGGKSGEIADHSAAQRDHEVGALDTGFDQSLAQALEHGKALGALARRYRRRGGGDAGLGERGLGGCEVVARDGLVGDDGHLGTRAQRSDPPPERQQLAAADMDLIAALPERNIDDDRIAGTQRRGHDS